LVAVIENTVVKVNEAWCKKCGVCIAFCPKKVLESDELGQVVVAKQEECIACLICERLCPDYAINIEVNKK
jgi:2-oxoglutarate ferredoxin oxidoreductase subunit delta